MKAQVVYFHCVLKTKLGKIISSTFNHEVITQAGGSELILRALADGLQGLKKGEKRSIQVRADQAYGYYDPRKVMEFGRDEVPNGLRPGEEVVLRDESGEDFNLRVVRISGDTVTMDGNHPLAGQDLVFDIEATDARDATAEELQQIEGAAPALH
jgi:FKBP-type peptidyl-prolyl cis-trans isomerase SlyD